MKTQKLSSIIYVAFFLLFGFSGLSQETSNLEKRKFQATLVYPIGSNGQHSKDIGNDFSYNIIAGHNGSVSVFELGGIYNVVSQDVRGAQISGFGNMVGGNVNGFQLAGFLNTNKGRVRGTQIAGFSNLVAEDVRGAQVAGFMNGNKGNVKGTQVAGFLNLNTGNAEAVQLAGFANVTEGSTKSQISGFLNKADNLSGVQVAGFVNKAGAVKGVQLGVINVADSLATGAQIGLVNISKNGFISLGLESDDNLPYQITFRSGMDYFYTLLFAGVHADQDYWAAGAGFGSRLFISPKKTFFFNPEFRWAQVVDGKIDYDKFSHLTKANINLGYQFNRNFFITAGPTANFFVTNDLDENGQPVLNLSDNLTIDAKNGGSRQQFWIGYHVGMGFRF